MAPSVIYIDEAEKVFLTDKKKLKEYGSQVWSGAGGLKPAVEKRLWEEWAVDGRGGQGKGRVLIKTRRSSRSIEARCGTGVGWKVEAGYGK